MIPCSNAVTFFLNHSSRNSFFCYLSWLYYLIHPIYLLNFIS